MGLTTFPSQKGITMNEPVIKKLYKVQGVKPSSELNNKILDAVNSVIKEHIFQEYDEIITVIAKTLGGYANNRSVGPVDCMLYAEITHHLRSDNQRYSVSINK